MKRELANESYFSFLAVGFFVAFGCSADFSTTSIIFLFCHLRMFNVVGYFSYFISP